MRFLLALALLSAPMLAADPQVVVQRTKLVAENNYLQLFFGHDVEIDGDTIVVGARGDDDPVTSGGSANVFVRSGSTWVHQARLFPDDVAPTDRFGQALALGGDTLLVGAYDKNVAGFSSGAAYVFVRSGTTWTQQARLTPKDLAAGDRFGISVALQGDVAVVSAPEENDFCLSDPDCDPECDSNCDSGAVYVFERTGSEWTEVAKLLPSDPDVGDRFGQAVALDGTTLLISAFGADDAPGCVDPGCDSGAVYHFELNGASWVEQGKILPADLVSGHRFGQRMDLDGDRAAFTATGDSEVGFFAGAAYVFERTGTVWNQVAKLLPDVTGDGYAASVALGGDRVYVGASVWHDPSCVHNISCAGTVFVYAEEGGVWSEALKLHPAPQRFGSRFGANVAVDGSTVLVGETENDDACVPSSSSNGCQSGAAWVFELEQVEGARWDPLCAGTAATCPCGNAGHPESGCENAQATGGVHLRLGVFTPDAAGGGTAMLEARAYTPNGMPTVVGIRSAVAEPVPVAFGDGIRCVGTQGLVRFGATLAAHRGSTHPYNHGAGAGTFHYQLWYRNTPTLYCDTARAFNLSNAISITWP